MKKFILLFTSVFIFCACLNNNDDDKINIAYELLPIDEYTTPTSFTFGEKDTIKIKYSLKNDCYYFNNVYYEYQDSSRIVAVRSFLELDNSCKEIITQQEYNLIVTAAQKEDYIFKFWKGTDSNGENIFEEVIVPVN